MIGPYKLLEKIGEGGFGVVYMFDAGAGKSDADVRALMDQAAATENLEVTLRACRYPSRMERWKSLPAEAFTSYEEPGVCEGGPPRRFASPKHGRCSRMKPSRRPCSRSSVDR